MTGSHILVDLFGDVLFGRADLFFHTSTSATVNGVLSITDLTVLN